MTRPSNVVLTCLASASVIALASCSREEPPESKPSGIPSTAAPQATRAAPVMHGRPATAQEIALVPDGTLLYSPDSGKPIQKNARTPALVYGGRLYFFCCPTSMQMCQADPRMLQNAKHPNGYDLARLKASDS